MKKANGPLDRITMALGVALLTATALTGCLGFVGGGGDYGGEVVVPGPDLYIFGGGYDRGRDVHDYSHRGTPKVARWRTLQGVRRRAPAAASTGESGEPRNPLDSELIEQKET